jgi:hypothetical protein
MFLKFENLIRRKSMAVEIKATFKKGDEDKEFVVAYDFGGNLEAAKAKFGEAVVYDNFVRSGKITIQAAIRRWAAAGLDEATIAEKVNTIVLGVPAERVVDPIAATLSRFASLDADAQIQLLEKLKSMKK